MMCFFTQRHAGEEATRTCTCSRTSRVLERAFVTAQYADVCMYICSHSGMKQAAGLGRIKMLW